MADPHPSSRDAPSEIDAELRFRTLFEQAPFSVQLLDASGRTLQVNKAWEGLWQVTDADGVKAYVLNEYNILTDPQLQAKGIADYVRRAFQGEAVTTPPICYDPAELGRPGRPRWVLGHLHPLKDDRGEVREVILIHEDATERMQTENALRTSEMRLKQLANTIPQLAWMADPAGWIHWYNDRWYEYTGTTPSEMEGWGWQSVHDPDVLPNVVEQWRRSIATGEPFQMTFPLRSRDGTFRPFFTLVAPLKDSSGNVLQWFGTNTDVSALHEAERELREAEERLRLATEAGDIGIWDWDITCDRIVWSERVYRLHGIPVGEFGGRLADFQKLIHPEDLPMLSSKVADAISGGEGFSAEFRAVLPVGDTKWLSTWARVSRSASGRAERLTGATISIDPYKKAEAALRDSDRRKDDFLAMLAHELRNPLAPLRNAAHVLRIKAEDRTVTHVRDMIDRQVTHMARIVDDLLDVSRIARGKIELHTSTTDLAHIVRIQLEDRRSSFDAAGLKLLETLPQLPVWVNGDDTRLTQILENLLDNAFKFTEPGGTVYVSLERDGSGENVAMVVRDTGVGLDPDILPHLFDVFSQADRTLARTAGGLGLGLAVVRGLAELHGGRVEAHSEGPGKGAEFRVWLPVTPEPQALLNATDDPARNTHSHLRILIIEDNRDAANSLRMLLELSGYEVNVAYTGDEGLHAARTLRPDAIVCDVGLPGMDGYAIAQELRKEPATSAVRLIALTGYGQEENRRRALNAGFDMHLVKPVDPAKLLQHIEPQDGAIH